MPRTPTVPSYRRHAPTGKAVVTLDGRDFYLGSHGSPESRTRYDRLVQEWLANGRRLPPSPSAAPAQLSIAELLEAYWSEAEPWYTKNGRATSHAHNIRDAMAPVLQLYGLEPVGVFGPLALKAVREVFVGRGLCRSTVNKHVGTVKRIFKWGTENELVPATVYHALQAVAGLRRGRSAAKEGEPVKPVPQAFVDAVVPHVSRQVAAMIRLQEVTGMRPGEVTIMRGCDLDTGGEVWTYTPSTHKTEHHGIERPIYLGPRAQEVIRPFLRPDTRAYLFDPREAAEEHYAARRAGRRTPMTPSQARRRRKPNPATGPQDHYTTDSYRRAVTRGCEKADALARQQCAGPTPDETLVEAWHPHQLRHNAATRLRKEYGLDVARVVLGHRTAAITEMYAEQDHARARDVMGRVG